MIWDCFMFFNELDVLEMRLFELRDLVDRFVLVESTLTFSGKTKPLHFLENKQRFLPYLSKIQHVIVDDHACSDNPWLNEAHQRNAIGLGLRLAGPDDTVLVSDVDEIPRPEAIREARTMGRLCMFEQRMSFYYANNVTDYTWYGTRSVPHRHFSSAQAVKRSPGQVLLNAGWHLTYLVGGLDDGVERMQRKIDAYSHQEVNRPPWNTTENLSDALSRGRDWGTAGHEFRRRRLDGDYPQALMWPKYRHYLLEDACGTNERGEGCDLRVDLQAGTPAQAHAGQSGAGGLSA